MVARLAVVAVAALTVAAVAHAAQPRQATSFPAVKVAASGAFTIKDGVAGLTVTGKFATPTSASGKVTLKGPGCKPVTFTAKR